jgi:hypothetical protein
MCIPVSGDRNSSELSASPALAWVEVRRAQVPSGMAIVVSFAVRRAVRLVLYVEFDAETGGSGLCDSALI